MGGDKPLRQLAGERMIDRAVRLARTYSDLVAVAVRDKGQVAPVDAQIIPDSVVEGPLGGLITGLQFASDEGRPLLLAIPADMPFLPRDLLDRLASVMGSDACAIASSGGRLHPVCSLWRAEALVRIPSYITTGRRSLHGLAELVGYKATDWPIESSDPFFNVNFEEDLTEAGRMLSD